MKPNTPEIPTCRYLDPESSRDNGNPSLPIVYLDDRNKYELPCDGIVIIGEVEQTLPVTKAISFVPFKGCSQQRRADLCPRKLGLKPPAQLQP